MLVGLAVSNCGLSLPCVSTPGRLFLCGRNLGIENCGTGSALGGQTETRRIQFPADPWFLCPDGSGRVSLGPGIWKEVVILPVLAGVWALLEEQPSPAGICACSSVWHRISSGSRWRLEDSCPRPALGSCVLRVPRGFFCAADVVLPALRGLSALLGGLLPPISIWLVSPVAEDLLHVETETGRPTNYFQML